MDWLNILDQAFDMCLVPLLGLAASVLIIWVRAKIAEGKERTNSDLADKYLGLLERTVIDCIRATNQTYVNALKDKNAFDAEAQKHALAQTTEAVLAILSEEAKEHLAHFVGDLDILVKEKIEANIED
jgi:hypothetical protein